eukprot:1237563-Amphidinium_carterae.1
MNGTSLSTRVIFDRNSFDTWQIYASPCGCPSSVLFCRHNGLGFDPSDCRMHLSVMVADRPASKQSGGRKQRQSRPRCRSAAVRYLQQRVCVWCSRACPSIIFSDICTDSAWQ